MKFSRHFNLTTLGYIILGIIITFLSAGVYTFFRVEEFSENMAYENALQESKRYAETLKSFRSLYTSEVIAEVLDHKQMKITHDYKDMKYDSTGAIPLPATLSMMLAEKMTASNTIVKLYSKYPFPWRANRQLTDFDVKAFDYFEANRDSDSAYYEFDRENSIVRYAIPDKMVTMSCVNCHNNHPQSPKVGWKLGDVRGAISITKPVNTTRVVTAASGTFALLGIIAIIVLFGLVIVISRIRSIRDSVNQTKSTLEKMMIGDFPEHDSVPDNEMKEVVHGLNVLKDNFRNVATFAKHVGKGDLTKPFHKLSEQDSLGMALIDMRNNLQKISEGDSRRSWSATGLSQMGEILRYSYPSETDLYDRIILFLVHYTKSNQAGFFLLNDDTHDEFLELVACYAYERKRYLSKRIEKDEGLVGQCYLEQEVILITSIPKGYVKITSGLGEALPNCLLLIPVKINSVVYGVIELISFNRFLPYQIEFMEKLAESIAAVTSTSKTNVRTRKLLEQTQQRTDDMKSQEEELRQNVEELASMQDEMLRKEAAYLQQINELNRKLNSLMRFMPSS